MHFSSAFSNSKHFIHTFNTEAQKKKKQKWIECEKEKDQVLFAWIVQCWTFAFLNSLSFLFALTEHKFICWYVDMIIISSIIYLDGVSHFSSPTHFTSFYFLCNVHVELFRRLYFFFISEKKRNFFFRNIIRDWTWRLSDCKYGTVNEVL